MAPGGVALPAQAQAALVCVQRGGSGIVIAACLAEANGQSGAAGILRSIDSCLQNQSLGVSTAACLADAVGEPETADLLRSIADCQTAGGTEAEIAACIAAVVGEEPVAQQIQIVQDCQTSGGSQAEVAACINDAIGDDETVQAVLGCFAEDTTGAEFVVCVINVVSPEQGALVGEVFGCIEAFRQDSDADGLLTCLTAAMDD